MLYLLRKIINMIHKFLIAICALVLGLTGCKKSEDATAATQTAPEGKKIQTPDWAKNATIYEMNIRQYTPEGTFKAIQPHLDRLADMGVKIVWLMPIHPISKTKRKGTLGSYYAVSGFRDVNPEYGTLYDLKVLVNEIHNRGMKVILDWVPHHTGWDHPWIKEHPEYYSHDAAGNIIDPINEETGEPWGWTDVAELKLDNPDMRKAIIGDMKYWIQEVGIDGYRVDHAHGLTDDYWNEVSDSLSRMGTPIFMLAEGEEPRLRNKENFVMTYAWKFHHAMNDVAQGKRNVNIFDTLLMRDKETYFTGYPMYFTSNHDENSWAGTEMERMGEGYKAFAVLSATIDGMPLVYSGQEEPLKKRLEFFEKDPIQWKDYAYHDFYKALLDLKKRNVAIWNGGYGARPVRINTSDHVYAFKRNRDDKYFVVVILNLSAQEQKTTLTEDTGLLRNIFDNKMISISKDEEITLKPWEYIVLSNI
jgi:glycosidase